MWRNNRHRREQWQMDSAASDLSISGGSAGSALSYFFSALAHLVNHSFVSMWRDDARASKQWQRDATVSGPSTFAGFAVSAMSCLCSALSYVFRTSWRGRQTTAKQMTTNASSSRTATLGGIRHLTFSHNLLELFWTWARWMESGIGQQPIPYVTQPGPASSAPLSVPGGRVDLGAHADEIEPRQEHVLSPEPSVWKMDSVASSESKYTECSDESFFCGPVTDVLRQDGLPWKPPLVSLHPISSQDPGAIGEPHAMLVGTHLKPPLSRQSVDPDVDEARVLNSLMSFAVGRSGMPSQIAPPPDLEDTPVEEVQDPDLAERRVLSSLKSFTIRDASPPADAPVTQQGTSPPDMKRSLSGRHWNPKTAARRVLDRWRSFGDQDSGLSAQESQATSPMDAEQSPVVQSRDSDMAGQAVMDSLMSDETTNGDVSTGNQKIAPPPALARISCGRSRNRRTAVRRVLSSLRLASDQGNIASAQDSEALAASPADLEETPACTPRFPDLAESRVLNSLKSFVIRDGGDAAQGTEAQVVSPTGLERILSGHPLLFEAAEQSVAEQRVFNSLKSFVIRGDGNSAQVSAAHDMSPTGVERASSGQPRLSEAAEHSVLMSLTSVTDEDSLLSAQVSAAQATSSANLEHASVCPPPDADWAERRVLNSLRSFAVRDDGFSSRVSAAHAVSPTVLEGTSSSQPCLAETDEQRVLRMLLPDEDCVVSARESAAQAESSVALAGGSGGQPWDPDVAERRVLCSLQSMVRQESFSSPVSVTTPVAGLGGTSSHFTSGRHWNPKTAVRKVLGSLKSRRDIDDSVSEQAGFDDDNMSTVSESLVLKKRRSKLLKKLIGKKDPVV